MPFNIKFKKSRQYSVMSKSLFVLKIELLDSSTIDCTLSSESTGQECLDNVCSRIGIAQPEFFGLRYLVKNLENEYRWIELERPLNRQLEKYAANTKILSLRVMYYVISGISLITDEVTRNYYFLQLKSDVVDGKLVCDVDKAVHLSNLARQAEYGNHQERHTVEYLKTLLSFPQHLIESNEIREELTDRVIQRHRELHNVSQKIAEEMYITECQQLDGYGQEPFLAKDMGNNEVTLGISVSGIIVSSNLRHKFYAWHDISNVVNHKRTFNIECTVPEQSIGFTLADADTGRYVWRLCVLQHTFFKNFEQKLMQQNGNPIPMQQQLFQNLVSDRLNDNRDESNWNLSENHLTNANSWSVPEIAFNNQSGSTNNLQSRNSLQTSALDVNLSTIHIDYATPANVGSNWGVNLASSNASLINRAQSSSCLDLSNNNNVNQDRDRLKALLPQYRPAPDYETAIQQKYRASSSDIRMSQSASTSAITSQMLPDATGSQPDMHRFIGDTYPDQQYVPQQFPDVTHTTSNPPIIGYNVPEHGLTQRFKMMRIVTAPPPYAVNRLSSTSTPDLHRALLGFRNGNGGTYNVSGSSPDLVSSRTFVHLPQGAHIAYPTHNIYHSQNILPHGTYENLNLMETTKANGFIQNHMQKIYENNKLLLCYPPEVSNILIHTDQFQAKPLAASIPQQMPQLASSQQQVNHGSIEPIYENIPLPWNSTTPNQVHTNSRSNNNNNNKQQKVLEDDRGIHNSSSTSNIVSNNQHAVIKKTASNPVVAHTTIEHFRHPSNSASVLDSSQSSSYTVDTNTTQTTDSGISTSGKEKKKRIWNILGRHKNNDKEKPKSATLGREKSKDNGKKNRSLSRDSDSPLKHRWSTGTSKQQPLPTTLSKEKLCHLLEMKLADSEIFYEFEGIPKHRENARYDCALQEENKKKNIDPNFLPYDDNRVRLTPTRENRLGYVNASHITCTVGRKQRFYIVAQSPTDLNTAGFFWQCVWEADVYLVVQLTDEFKYVPANSERCLEYGQYQVWREFSQESDLCTTSKLRVYHTQSRRYRSIWHLLYNNWGDQNCPKDVGHFVGFIEELSSVKLASVNEVPQGHNTNPPVLMHCNDASARSGLTVAADLLLYVLDHNQELDIPRVVCQLRQQRATIIPSLALYKCIYSLLIHYLKQTRLI